jgi:hypothetical protein
MQIKIVFFVVGSGGNFLNRVLTLDPTTVPMGAGQQQQHFCAEQRYQRYHYDRVKSHVGSNSNEMLANCLTRWVDHELNFMYFPLSMGMERLIQLDQMVIEMIHPHHWIEKQKLFGIDDRMQFFYIDPSACVHWVVDQCMSKVFPSGAQYERVLASVENSINQLQEIVSQLNTIETIYLDRIIGNEDSFLEEYQRICNSMALQSYTEYAKEIYRSWKTTWAVHE